MPLRTKVGLGPGHIVLDGDPAPQKGTHQPPISAYLRIKWHLDSSSRLATTDMGQKVGRGFEGGELGPI